MTFFKDDNNNNNRQNKIKKKANKKPFTKGENMLKADEFYYKKICGYVFFKEILIEREKRTRCEEACYFFRCLANYFCRCFECITIIIVSFRDCLKNSFCYICKKKCNCYCYHCECCRGSECCCCDTNSFGNNEIDFCLCYQEEKCSIWFYDYINNKEQQWLILFIFIIAFFQFFTIGLEEIYDEKNKNNINQENIGFQLFLACIIYVGGCLIMVLLMFPFLKYIFSNQDEDDYSKIDNIDMITSFLNKANIIKKSSFSFFIGTIVFIPIANSISSLIFSIKYLKDKTSFYEGKYYYLPIYWNKFSIFILSYLILNQDEENELLSHSTIISIYLYILELIISGIKKIFSINALIIIDLVFSGIMVIILFLSIVGLLCTQFID